MKSYAAETLEKLGVASHVGNKTEMPLKHYRELFAAADPKKLSARSGVPYNEADSVFEMAVFGCPIDVLWPEMDVVMASNGAKVPVDIQLLAARLILEGVLTAASGEFLSYAQVPNGTLYLDAFDRRCTIPLSKGFADAQDFSAKCEKLGCAPVEGGDAAFETEFMPGLFVRITYWEADEEFAASAKLLFSDNFPLAFTSEDMAVVGSTIAALLA